MLFLEHYGQNFTNLSSIFWFDLISYNSTEINLNNLTTSFTFKLEP